MRALILSYQYISVCYLSNRSAAQMSWHGIPGISARVAWKHVSMCQNVMLLTLQWALLSALWSEATLQTSFFLSTMTACMWAAQAPEFDVTDLQRAAVTKTWEEFLSSEASHSDGSDDSNPDLTETGSVPADIADNNVNLCSHLLYSTFQKHNAVYGVHLHR